MSSDKKLEDMSIAELRQEASRHRVPLTRDMNRSMIIEALRAVKDSSIDRIVGAYDTDRPLPGYARIEISREADPKASNADVYVQVNGYAVLIKRGVAADVPIKILHALTNAKMKIMREDNTKGLTDPERYKFEDVYSYPFTVHAITDGPDPKPGIEAVARNRNAPRRRFHEKHGYWPKPAELKEWLRGGGDKEPKTKE
jgi:hypothetical protein